MGCSSCKQKNTPSPMTKEEAVLLSRKIEKVIYVVFSIMFFLSIYGLYSLFR